MARPSRSPSSRDLLSIGELSARTGVAPSALRFYESIGLLASAVHSGGKATAVIAALALMAGAGLGDVGVVLLGGLGVRRAGHRVARWVRRGLALVLAALGVWLIMRGVVG